MTKIDWNIVKQAVDNGVVSLSDAQQDELYNFVTSLDEAGMYVVNQAIEQGVNSMSQGNYDVYQDVKRQYSAGPQVQAPKPQPIGPDSVVTADGSVLYDNTSGNEMALSDLYNDIDSVIAPTKRNVGPVQDTIYGPDGTMYIDKEFEPVKREIEEDESLELKDIMNMGKMYGKKALNKLFN